MRVTVRNTFVTTTSHCLRSLVITAGSKHYVSSSLLCYIRKTAQLHSWNEGWTKLLILTRLPLCSWNFCASNHTTELQKPFHHKARHLNRIPLLLTWPRDPILCHVLSQPSQKHKTWIVWCSQSVVLRVVITGVNKLLHYTPRNSVWQTEVFYGVPGKEIKGKQRQLHRIFFTSIPPSCDIWHITTKHLRPGLNNTTAT